ncbi:MAG TPA: hypothetical protein VF013_08990 [Candidatus Limnocylindria bacterium]
MSGRFGVRAAVASVAAVAAIQLSCVAATAAQGVALDTGRISVETPLTGGKSYQLARLNVRNPGTFRTKYDLVVTPIRTTARTPQASWISFSPKQVTLQAGKQQTVTVSIRLPANAAGGRYEVLIGAHVAPSANGMAIAAGAAARLTFTVASPATSDPIVTVISSWWPVPTLAILGAGLLLGRHRFRFRLRMPVERR